MVPDEQGIFLVNVHTEPELDHGLESLALVSSRGHHGVSTENVVEFSVMGGILCRAVMIESEW
jgi:hypothetical protein